MTLFNNSNMFNNSSDMSSMILDSLLHSICFLGTVGLLAGSMVLSVIYPAIGIPILVLMSLLMCTEPTPPVTKSLSYYQ